LLQLHIFFLDPALVSVSIFPFVKFECHFFLDDITHTAAIKPNEDTGIVLIKWHLTVETKQQMLKRQYAIKKEGE